MLVLVIRKHPKARLQKFQAKIPESLSEKYDFDT
jgi:hypothetical protein